MTLELLYFAAVRDLLGTSSEQVEVPDSVTTVAQLEAHLKERYPELRERMGSIRIAVNEAFAAPSEPVADGDTVALIPPVAGG